MNTAAFGNHRVQLDVRGDCRVLRAESPAVSRFATVPEMLLRAAAIAPDRTFLRQRGADGDWSELSYADADIRSRVLADAFRARGLGPDRPLLILSGNSIDHAILSLAAQRGGVPVVPVSTAYSQFDDQSRLRSILGSFGGGLVFAEDPRVFSRSLDLARELGFATCVDPGELVGDDPWPEAGPEAVADSVAKILFTSGSTGTPKGVLITQRMMASNQDALVELWPFLEAEPPTIVDWLPWNHVFGGCLVFNCVLANAGTLVIDEGRPVPGQWERSLRNLREARPTVYLGVPSAIRSLAESLAADLSLAADVLSRLRVVFSAGAALPQSTFEELRRISAAVRGDALPVFIGWGATETAPLVTVTSATGNRAGAIGLPVPGAEVKLVPHQDKEELRVRGPMVTPGYWGNPELTREAFDEEGFYRTGDAGRLDGPGWELDGILFDGRVAENFKLSSGVWVNVGALRLAMIEAARPLLDDVAVTGADQDEIGALAFPNMAAARKLAGLSNMSPPGEVLAHPSVRAHLQSALDGWSDRGGNSTRVRRAVLLSRPPSPETGEMTDKGYLNQRAVLANHVDLVDRLHANPPGPDVVVAATSGARTSLTTTPESSSR